MTALTNIQRHAYAPSFNGRARIMHYAFEGLQSRGFVTHMTVAWIAGAVLTYLIAAYSLFGLGVTMQQKSAVLKELTETNTIVELNIQQKQTEFAKNNEDILQSMEKISDMRYVLPLHTSVSRADVSDQINQ